MQRLGLLSLIFFRLVNVDTVPSLTKLSMLLSAPRSVYLSRPTNSYLWPKLKSLYVALTRARRKLWIADQSAKGAAMKVGPIRRIRIFVC